MNKFLLVFVLFTASCANNQIIEQNKREVSYRKSLEMSEGNSTPTAGPGPLEMPQEWIDQWTKHPIDKNQK